MVASVFQCTLSLLVLAGSLHKNVEGFVPSNSPFAGKRSGPLFGSIKNEEGNERQTILNNDAAREASDRMDRRRAIASTGLAVMSLWLGETLGQDHAVSQWAANAAEEAGTGRTVLITGCNSGVGLEGARILARRGDKLVLACRTMQKAQDTAKLLLAETPTASVVPAECDLASLDSIQKFASTVGGGLDVVCYNAGLALDTAGAIERTSDGFEKTVGINHLGHFYLHHLLEPKIAATGGKVVVTASSVHDPESGGGKQGVPATLGNLEGFSRDGAGFEMVDGAPYNGDKAYKDSKLCNVFFTRELARRLADKKIAVNCFSPGLITSGNFFRYQNPLFSKVFNVAASSLIKVAETTGWGGAALAYMTTIDGTTGEFYETPPGTSNKYSPDDNYKGAFGKEFTVAQVSKEAQDDNKGKELWKLSEKLVGI